LPAGSTWQVSCEVAPPSRKKSHADQREDSDEPPQLLDAVAKPYACGNKTCSTHPTKSNCQVCKSAVCDLNNKGQEVLVPGTATTTTCTEPAKVETPPATPPSKVPTTRAPVERPVAR